METKMAIKTFEIALSIPCLWEEGHALRMVGEGIIICKSDGSMKNYIYHGPLFRNDQYLIPIGIGDVVVEATHYFDVFQIRIWRISKIKVGKAYLDLVARLTREEGWTDNGKAWATYYRAIAASVKKATQASSQEAVYALKRWEE